MSEAEGEERNYGSGKPLKVLAFDEARFGLINWHQRRYCLKGFRPPWVVRRAYDEWTYLFYAAVDPATGESSWLYLPGMDRLCLEAFSWGTSERRTPTITSWSWSTAPRATAPRGSPTRRT